MVKYLSWYMGKKIDAKAQYKVNIKQEVEKYKQKHPDTAKPIVVFDFIGTIPILFQSYSEVIYGGRYGECIYRAEEIFSKFRDLGVELVFFLDGPIKAVKFPEWCRRKNDEYELQKQLFANLKAREPLNYRFQKFLKTYYENFLRVAKKYGRLFISLHNECDLDLAEFASRMKPLAVLGHDSDFLIMPGDFPIWLPGTLDVKHMTVTAWNKGRLRKALGLEQWQMPIFATLCGNDWIAHKYVEHVGKRVSKESGNAVVILDSLANLVRETFRSKKDIDLKLSKLICPEGFRAITYQETVRLVKMSLHFYDYKTHKVTRIEPDWLKDHISQTASFIVFIIYKQRILHIPQSYIDVSKDDCGSFSDLALPILRREMGIIRCRRDACEDTKYSICLKPCAETPFAIHEYSAIYPDFGVPAIDDILSNDEDIISLEKRVELYIWVVHPKRKTPKLEVVLKLLKTLFIIPSMIANYLLQERQITVDEADILLLSIYEASRMERIKSGSCHPPKNVTERPFWLAFVYVHLVRFFEEAMTCCGLYQFVPYSHFDGYIFHKMYEKFLKMPYDGKKEILKPISDYRLYAM